MCKAYGSMQIPIIEWLVEALKIIQMHHVQYVR